MSSNKKIIRQEFRDSVFKRDGYKCRVCGLKSSIENANTDLDAHHITARILIINQGYVKENGISLCKNVCHLKAEEFYSAGIAHPGYSVDDLYILIGSNLEKAIEASKKLK
jgi:predicted restriction endonuclease